MSTSQQDPEAETRGVLSAVSDEDVDRSRLLRAVEEGGFGNVDELVLEATDRLVDELLDGDGQLDCPHDDCSRAFATRRQLRGHLGSSEHALDVPEGDFWCGYCGFGATTWRGVNAHHGQSDHDGDPVRLEDQPNREDLLAPDDVPDHKNPDLLERLYRECGGNYTEMCRQHDFDVGDGRVRHYLIEFGIHEVTPQGATGSDDGPRYRDPDWLEEQYESAGRNISEMHRQIEVDVPYRTLQKNLKRFGIHDPTDPPGKRQSWEQREGSDQDEDASEAEEGQENDQEDVEDECVPEGSETDDPVDEEDVEEDGAGSETDDWLDDVLAVDYPSDVDSFHDFHTPIWLDEGSFYSAVDMADDVDDLANALGWDERRQLEAMVEHLDLDVEVAGGDGNDG